MIERRLSHLHPRLTALGVVALLTCTLLVGASAAAASLSQPYPETSLSEPYPDALWREFPLDPRRPGNKASTDAGPASSLAQTGNAMQKPSQSERSEPTGEGSSESGSLPLPGPVLLALALGVSLLLWLFVVSTGSFRRSRRIVRRAIVPRLQAGLRGGNASRTETSIVPRVEAALGGGHAPREEETEAASAAPDTVAEDDSAAPDTVVDPCSSDTLVWLEAEVERARRGHDVLSLLLVSSGQPADRPESGEDLTEALATAIEEALHDVPRELRRDGELVSVILPHTLAEGAKRLAARVPLFVPEAMPETRTHLSVRTAVACFPRDASTAEELLQICEQALAVQREGRSAG
jgi:hypothetical protein